LYDLVTVGSGKDFCSRPLIGRTLFTALTGPVWIGNFRQENSREDSELRLKSQQRRESRNVVLVTHISTLVSVSEQSMKANYTDVFHWT